MKFVARPGANGTLRRPGTAAKAKAVVFYDGGCPLCRAEIDHYRRLDGGRRVDWLDITEERRLLNAFGVSYQSAMQSLHVLAPDGRLTDGAYAFAVVWAELPYYRWLAKLLYASRTLTPLDMLYRRFARWRYRRRCSDAGCATGSSLSAPLHNAIENHRAE